MVKITHRTLKRFPRDTEDKNNITKTSRNFVNYLKNLRTGKHKLKKDMEKLIMEGKQFSILDCGAGQGIALGQLLESGFGNTHVKKATGISLHAFKNAKNLLLKHKNLDWHIDDAFNVLPKLKPEYDILVDMWGTYSYIDERVKLLKLYHSALAPGGKAYIYISGKNCIVENHEDISDCVRNAGENDLLGELFEGTNRFKYIRLEKHLAKKYPETFQYGKNVLVMRKASIRFPVIDDIEIVHQVYDSSVRTKDKESSVKGNSWYPKMVIFKCEPRSHVGLRKLPFNNVRSNRVKPIRRVNRERPDEPSMLQKVWSYVQPFIPNVFKAN